MNRLDLLRLGAVLSFVAGIVHIGNAPEHLTEWWGYGLFFLFASVAQFYYALTLWLLARSGAPGDDRVAQGGDEDFFLLGCPRILWYKLGILGNLSIILLYGVTRTIGIPLLGPAAGVVEPVTPLGLVSKVAEAGLVLCLWVLQRPPERARFRVAG